MRVGEEWIVMVGGEQGQRATQGKLVAGRGTEAEGRAQIGRARGAQRLFFARSADSNS